VRIAQNILGIKSARELAGVMGAVGLAQNFSAIRALGTEGIQRGHMTLHARSVASTAGTPTEFFDQVLERLLDSGEIKVWKAKEIIEELKSEKRQATPATQTEEELDETLSFGYGKIIVSGEHSVVYGKHAVAAPINLKMKARVRDIKSGVRVSIPRWGVEHKLTFGARHQYTIYNSLEMILENLNLQNRGMNIEIFPEVPRAAGMGGSSALAVAIIRALDRHYELGMNDTQVRELSFKSEDIVHGGASGIDNTVSTYGRLITYQKADPPKMEEIDLKKDIPVVIGLSGVESMTSGMVSKVRKNRERFPKLYNGILDQMDSLALASREAIENYDLVTLGEIMNLNHGYLNALQVSCPEVEDLVQTARNSGALGAKLTGGGGGGAIIALCDSKEMQLTVKEHIRKKGFDAIITEIKSGR